MGRGLQSGDCSQGTAVRGHEASFSWILPVPDYAGMLRLLNLGRATVRPKLSKPSSYLAYVATLASSSLRTQKEALNKFWLLSFY